MNRDDILIGTFEQKPEDVARTYHKHDPHETGRSGRSALELMQKPMQKAELAQPVEEPDLEPLVKGDVIKKAEVTSVALGGGIQGTVLERGFSDLAALAEEPLLKDLKAWKAWRAKQGKGKAPKAAGGTGKRGRKAMPIGTIRTHKNGQRVQKVAEGKWKPIKEKRSSLHEGIDEKPKKKKDSAEKPEGKRLKFTTSGPNKRYSRANIDAAKRTQIDREAGKRGKKQLPSQIESWPTRGADFAKQRRKEEKAAQEKHAAEQKKRDENSRLRTHAYEAGQVEKKYDALEAQLSKEKDPAKLAEMHAELRELSVKAGQHYGQLGQSKNMEGAIGDANEHDRSSRKWKKAAEEKKAAGEKAAAAKGVLTPGQADTRLGDVFDVAVAGPYDKKADPGRVPNPFKAARALDDAIASAKAVPKKERAVILEALDQHQKQLRDMTAKFRGYAAKGIGGVTDDHYRKTMQVRDLITEAKSRIKKMGAGAGGEKKKRVQKSMVSAFDDLETLTKAKYIKKVGDRYIYPKDEKKKMKAEWKAQEKKKKGPSVADSIKQSVKTRKDKKENPWDKWKGYDKSMGHIEELEALVKGGPYIGKRGGKWADPQHKIPWNEKKHGGGKKEPKAKEHDEVSARELQLYIENTGSLHNQTESIRKNLVNRMANGTYDHAQASKLFGYLADAGSKAYNKEHGSGAGHAMSPQDRRAAARKLAHDFHDMAREGEYDHHLNKKNQKAVGSLKGSGNTQIEGGKLTREHLEAKVHAAHGSQKHAKTGEKLMNSPDGKTDSPHPNEVDRAMQKTKFRWHKNEAKKHDESAHLLRRRGPGSTGSTEKSMSVIDELEALAKSVPGQGGFPAAGGPRSGLPGGGVEAKGQAEDGGVVAGAKGAGAGSTDAGSATVASTTGCSGPGKKQKLSEDDAEDEGQMKPHKKPIEKTARKSMDLPALYEKLQKSQHGREFLAIVRNVAAVGRDPSQMFDELYKSLDVTVGLGNPDTREVPLWKSAPQGEAWSQPGGMVLYSDASDRAACEQLEKGYHQQDYSVGKGEIRKSMQCPNCEGHTPAMFTSCQYCGVLVKAVQQQNGLLIG